LLSSENANGGFGPRPGTDADISSTYYAIAALSELDVIDKINWEKHAKFINSKRKNVSENSIFFAVMALDNLYMFINDTLIERVVTP
jgi:prenyltransferase beta subunit